MEGSIFETPLDILVLMGGPSSERAVSLVSGRAVADALTSRGHRVRTADINPNDVSALDQGRPDVVFIALHGAFGEDGRVQLMCEQRQLPYVGSSPQASELAMDKAASKECYRQAGLLTPDWTVLDQLTDPGTAEQALARLHLPCVIKPLDAGSSVDVTICRDEQSRSTALQSVLTRYGRAMVEQFIHGRELTVGVLGEQALPIIEIRPKRSFYDYTAKYSDDATEYVFDTGLTGPIDRAIRQAGLKAHQSLGCRDMSRSDFLLDDQGRAWLLETNTIPGFTSHSLLPKAAERTGFPFARLCEELVRMAYRRSQVGPSSTRPAMIRPEKSVHF